MRKIAVIGAGRIGRIHAANAVAHPELSVAAIVDPVAEAAESLAKVSGCEVASISEIMSDPTIEGVIIASSTDTHLEYTLMANRAGKAVFCEKPVDQNLERARAAEAELIGGRILIAFNRRFDPNFAALQSRIGGEMGPLESLQITSLDPAPPPISYVETSGGLFKDMAIHDFDMARWLLNEDVAEVFAWGACLVDPEIGSVGDIDTARIVLRTESGKLCVIANSRRSGYGYDQRIEAFCSNGLVSAGNETESTVQIWRKGGASMDEFRNFFLERYEVAYRREMAHFADIMADRAKSLVTYSDGVAALALAEAANRSLASGLPERP